MAILYFFSKNGLSRCGRQCLWRRVLSKIPPLTESASIACLRPQVGDFPSIPSLGRLLGTPRWSINAYHRVRQVHLFGLLIHGSCSIQCVHTLDSSVTCHSHSSSRWLLFPSDLASFGVRFLPSSHPRGCHYRCRTGDPHNILFHRGLRRCTH